MTYCINSKGRSILRSTARLGLTGHVRDLLALCEPQIRLDQARQCMPPASLQTALFTLLQLELVDGPAVPPPPEEDAWLLTTISRRIANSIS